MIEIFEEIVETLTFVRDGDTLKFNIILVQDLVSIVCIIILLTFSFPLNIYI